MLSHWTWPALQAPICLGKDQTTPGQVEVLSFFIPEVFLLSYNLTCLERFMQVETIVLSCPDCLSKGMSDLRMTSIRTFVFLLKMRVSRYKPGLWKGLWEGIFKLVGLQFLNSFFLCKSILLKCSLHKVNGYTYKWSHRNHNQENSISVTPKVPLESFPPSISALGHTTSCHYRCSNQAASQADFFHSA